MHFVLNFTFLPIADQAKLIGWEAFILVGLVLELALFVNLGEGSIGGCGLEDLGEKVASQLTHVQLLKVDHVEYSTLFEL